MGHQPVTAVLVALVMPFAAVSSAAAPETLRGAAADQMGEAVLEANNLLVENSDAATPPVEGAPVESEDMPVTILPVPHDPQLEPLFEEPKLSPVVGMQSVGRLLGSFTMAERLDSHRALFNLKLGDKMWDLSMASDPKFDVMYLTLGRSDDIWLHRIENLSDLRGAGVNVEVEPGVVYNFKVKINIFSPTRGSKLKIIPARGTAGPKHSIKTGTVLDAVKRESFVFKAGKKELWLLYGTDADPETNDFADTRTLLFIYENGMSSKAWPVPEARLEPGTPLQADLGGTKLVLLRTPEGELRIHEPGKGLAGAPSAR